ncbi:hypothetical protein HU200_030509 [Digitaria exilis]|uniref:Non-specific lipid-transfer protein n=1 Tax=Digitaria exilis TaxID=1010633 RepID=A0A835BNZ6_9POAL|nr:hypothetical protein HU200_030509 [Digitaria exilis]CAB3462867.1 unnamed protein product [Digitaria exilis]
MARPAGQAHQQVTVLMVVALCFLMTTTTVVNGGVSCGQVVGWVSPCISYAMGQQGTSPPPACCSGVKSLNDAAHNTADRQATCKCLKQATSVMHGLKPDLVAGIPSKCGVHIPYPISGSTDCSK